MSDFTPNIALFCCHYTSQQTLADNGEALKESGFPECVAINRLSCGGKLQVSALLKAFEDGADLVYMVGCPEDQCHNVMGSQRAAKKVLAVKKALAELGVESERVEMFHMERGFHPEFVTAARKMEERARKLGPSPLKGENK